MTLIGQKLRTKRKSFPYTLKEVVDRVNAKIPKGEKTLSESQLSKIENNKALLSTDRLAVALGEVLELDPNEIVEYFRQKRLAKESHVSFDWVCAHPTHRTGTVWIRVYPHEQNLLLSHLCNIVLVTVGKGQQISFSTYEIELVFNQHDYVYLMHSKHDDSAMFLHCHINPPANLDFGHGDPTDANKLDLDDWDTWKIDRPNIFEPEHTHNTDKKVRARQDRWTQTRQKRH